jgi:peptidoglycan-N-acetylglucosamine deacetylase
MTISIRCLAAALCGLCGLAAASAAASTDATTNPALAQIAITFDDLPSHGPLPPGLTRTDVVRRIIEALQDRKAPPVYGFLNASALKWDASGAEALNAWRDAGNLLGNHGYSHLDANAVSAEAFEADILANEPELEKAMAGADWHWMRLPFLRTGDTPEKRSQIAAFLDQHHYRLADETVTFNDYEYNPVYVRCLAKNDQDSIAWLKTHFLIAADNALSAGRIQAEAAFGRDIKHVFLLHIGAFDALMFPALLDMLKLKHFTLIALPEAASDPAFAAYGKVETPWGGVLQQRALEAQHLALPSVPSENTSAALDRMCR